MIAPSTPATAGRQLAAARVLTGISREALSAASGVPVDVLRRIELAFGIPSGLEAEAASLGTALENAGAEFIGENGGGVGVRLRFNRRDVRAIDTLENEGGTAGDDDI